MNILILIFTILIAEAFAIDRCGSYTALGEISKDAKKLIIWKGSRRELSLNLLNCNNCIYLTELPVKAEVNINNLKTQNASIVKIEASKFTSDFLNDLALNLTKPSPCTEKPQ